VGAQHALEERRNMPQHRRKSTKNGARSQRAAPLEGGVFDRFSQNQVLFAAAIGALLIPIDGSGSAAS
jgi:hypothetical protein